MRFRKPHKHVASNLKIKTCKHTSPTWQRAEMTHQSEARPEFPAESRKENHAILALHRPSPSNDFNKFAPPDPHDSEKEDKTHDSQGRDECHDPNVLTWLEFISCEWLTSGNSLLRCQDVDVAGGAVARSDLARNLLFCEINNIILVCIK